MKSSADKSIVLAMMISRGRKVNRIREISLLALNLWTVRLGIFDMEGCRHNGTVIATRCERLPTYADVMPCFIGAGGHSRTERKPPRASQVFPSSALEQLREIQPPVPPRLFQVVQRLVAMTFQAFSTGKTTRKYLMAHSH